MELPNQGKISLHKPLTIAGDIPIILIGGFDMRKRLTIGLFEVANLLGISRKAVLMHATAKGVEPLRVGRRILFSYEDLVELLGEKHAKRLFGPIFGVEPEAGEADEA